MQSLINPVRSYAWGSRSAIAALLGQQVPAPHPEAELWMGAHPQAPSMLVDAAGERVSLLDVVRADAAGELGADNAARWGDRLPFLLKVLAAEEPLSLQAHPSAEQAREGFAREEAAGIALGAANRNYPDPAAKPELLCALSEFHALAGFREPASTVALLKSLVCADLVPYTELLAGQPDSAGLRALFTTWITLPQSSIKGLLPKVLDACVEHVKEHGAFDVECRTVLGLGETYPHDPGVLAALLLNHVVLQPGEAIYLPAGNPHSYLHGTGIEVLANSDNVLRCGLTPKHVDVPELLRVLDFSAGDPVKTSGERTGDRLCVYRTPAEEFELSIVDWLEGEPDTVSVTHSGPQIVLCLRGVVEVCSAGQRQKLRRGESVWLSARDRGARLVPIGGEPSMVCRATAGTG
ncbi:MAG: mannose-6-phosphate isomerase, class I [Sciscionella sp.]